MFKVDNNRCIGCGICIKDCFVRDIEMIDGKASIKNKNCFRCGHCVAICPVNAVSTDDFPMDDVAEYSRDNFQVESENLLNFIKFRRTTRQYQDRDIENEKLLKIIEAGRFTPTATNSQDVAFTVVKKDILEVRDITLKTLRVMAENILKNSEDMKIRRYAKMWLTMNDDNLFYRAPALIIVTAKNPTNGHLASSNMELMTNAMGLGAVYCGFFTVASDNNPEIGKYLQIPEDRKIVSCLVVGYPAVSYKRTAPRKSAEISWR
ncbi:MAG: nitroreductase family protein [Fusobacteriaceae bacterium]